MSNHVHLVFLGLSMVRITNCRFKRFTSQPIVKAYRKIQEKAEKISCWIFLERLKKLKCKALSILET
jgi:hypothetical protein